MIETTPSLVLLDVRNQSEYDAGHIRNAKLISLWELATRLSELNKTDEILVYCRLGERSTNASQILDSNGFLHVHNMLGGMTEWIRQGYPVYVKYPSIQEAINNASAGETIYISGGLYTEPLAIDKSLALEGENRHTAIINAATNTTIYVNADNVSISEFTLKYSPGCACYDLPALNVTGRRDISIMNNVIISDDHGIKVGDATNLTLAYNNFTCPNSASIVALNTSGISFFGNTIKAADGMELDNCAESVFSDNAILSAKGAGIFAFQSDQNTFSDNQILADASTAISITNCCNNAFLCNNISSKGSYGLFFWQSNNNTFIHNNFLGNGGRLAAYISSSAFWNNGFEGNFWSNYTGVDANFDGIGDTPNILDSENMDTFPLKGMFHGFKIALDSQVDIVSDSAISEIEYVEPDRIIRFRVSNATSDQMVGFCRMSIPHSLIDPYNSSISVVIDDGLTPVLFLNTTLHDNDTHRWIYFTYPISTHEVSIVPEFPVQPILSVLMAIITILGGALGYRSTRMMACKKLSGSM